MKHIIRSMVPQLILDKYGARQAKKAKAAYLDSFRGDEVSCPICKAHYKIFAPFGVKKRDNARCLNCGSLERHRLLYLYMKEKMDVLDHKGKAIRFLHFAPERMFYNLFSKAEGIAYTACDLFPERYDHGGNTPVVKVDITQIPFADASFDLILCNHVLEHIPDDRLAMSELYRVMAPNGQGIFQVPIDLSRPVTYEDPAITSPEEREKAFGQYDHVRWYGQDYVARLESVGFKVNVDPYVTKFTKEESHRYGLSRSELIYHCSK